jgi:hypothetical protein
VNAIVILVPPVSVTTTLPYWEIAAAPDAGYGPEVQGPPLMDAVCENGDEA